MSVHHPAANSLLFNTHVQYVLQTIRLKITSIFHVVILFARNAGPCISKRKLIKVKQDMKHDRRFVLFLQDFFLNCLGISTAIGCMASKCNVRVPEELVLSLLTKPTIRDKYQQFTFLDYVKSHPQLRFCPGPNCQVSKTHSE